LAILLLSAASMVFCVVTIPVCIATALVCQGLAENIRNETMCSKSEVHPERTANLR
jgi:hypothetical protein